MVPPRQTRECAHVGRECSLSSKKKKMKWNSCVSLESDATVARSVKKRERQKGGFVGKPDRANKYSTKMNKQSKIFFENGYDECVVIFNLKKI